MYKFNFLSKINQEKLETKKRERFIKLIFMSSTLCLGLILGILYLYSLSVGSSYEAAVDHGNRLKDKTTSFRDKEFFKYRNIQSVYNTTMKRKKFSSIFEAVETSLDSSIILSSFIYKDDIINLRFVSRSTSSKSQLMSVANNLKNSLFERFQILKYLDDKTNEAIDLSKSPDILKTVDDLQYWYFDFNVLLKNYESIAPAKIEGSESSSGLGLGH